jgi:hypothetical protein
MKKILVLGALIAFLAAHTAVTAVTTYSGSSVVDSCDSSNC